jgi:hypothetical protein
MSREGQMTGAVVGSAVGDALGAPFEFGRPGTYRRRFPDGIGEMCGGGGWDPGEATDDTQMAVLLGESLLERGGLDLADIFGRFQRWAAGEPKDIGLQTEDVLTNGEPWDRAAALHLQTNLRAAGNGSLMRATTSAVYFAPSGREATMNAARRIAALTHGDGAAWEGTAVFHELIRVALNGGDPLSMGRRPRTRLAPGRGHGVQRGGLAVSGLGPVGAAHDGLVRGGTRRRDQSGRRHGYGDGGHGRSGGRGVRPRGDPGPLDGPTACAVAGLREPRAADAGTDRTGKRVGAVGRAEPRRSRPVCRTGNNSRPRHGAPA